MGKVTMKDIAQVLNISTVTVSKALSDKDGVSLELKEKIKDTAKSMGYRYNSIAKGMKEGKSYNIGIIIAERFVKDDSEAFYLKMYQNVIEELYKLNYYGIMEIIPNAKETELVIPNIILENKVDGVIVLGQMCKKYLELLKSTKIPLVFMDFDDDPLEVDCIVSDNIYDSYRITNYLISEGHKEIGFVGNVNATTSIMDRYLGYLRALQLNRIPVNDAWIIKDREDEGDYIDFELPAKLPTAFVCNCDGVAYLFIRKLKSLGYKVPEQISVVGYDNYTYNGFSSTKLTTVAVDMKTMAEVTIGVIMRKIEGDTQTQGRKVISGNLIFRDTVKKLN